MADRIDNAMDKLETALLTLVVANGTGTLRAVARRLLNPVNEPLVPVVCLLPLSVRRSGGPGSGAVWNLDVAISICTRTRETASDSSVSALIAAVQTVIDTLASGGSAGAAIDLPAWDFWYMPGVANTPCGAHGTIRVRIQGNLAV